MKKRNLRNTAIASALLAAVGLGACGGDSAVGIDEDLDHGVERIQLVVNSATTAEFDGSSWTGELDVTEGTSTAQIDVRLIDHNGAVVTPPSNISLGVDITNGTVARWEQVNASAFSGHLQGLSAGTTQAVFKLMRSGQAVYETTAVDVHVNTP